MTKHHRTERHHCVGGRWAGPDAETTVPCVVRYQHRADCEELRAKVREMLAKDVKPDEVLAQAAPDLREAHACPGCLPREATSGYLCDTCHTHLEEWLGDGPNGIAAVHVWLGANLTPTSSSAAREDWERSGTSEDLPAAIRPAIFDCRRLLEDRVYIAEERARSAGIGEPLSEVGLFDFGRGCAYLRRYILKIEEDALLVGELYRKLQASMIEAHGLAPWRATATKVRDKDGPIACPECERKSLMQFGGSDYVKCTSCGAAIDNKRFGIWTEMIEQQREGESA